MQYRLRMVTRRDVLAISIRQESLPPSFVPSFRFACMGFLLAIPPSRVGVLMGSLATRLPFLIFLHPARTGAEGYFHQPAPGPGTERGDGWSGVPGRLARHR